jgi:CRP-like cAMP-binding protein
MIDRFITFLRQFGKITDAEISKYVLPIAKERKFAKKEFILKAGEVEKHINFIAEGLVTRYYLNDTEKRIVQLATEGKLVINKDPNTPSEFYVQALEPTTIISLDSEDLEEIYSKSHNMEHFGRMVTRDTLYAMCANEINIVRQEPRTKFLNFVENHPELLQRVPQKYLASYLNIKPETFSRFKHLLKPKKQTFPQKTKIDYLEKYGG